MEAYPNSSSKRKDGSELSLREWGMKAQSNNYYGEKTKSRRHSASYIRSFNEETKSFRSSNITFSSATSSPAYPFNKDHGIDPSTYSFNSAIKALQARSCYNSWECLSPDGFALNSKWNEAEKYICNPLSGEVPIECLSSKALISGRSFRKSIPNKVIAIISEDHNDDDHTLRNAQTKTSSSSTYYTQEEDDHEALHHYFPTIPEKKKEGKTRDVGIQSTSPYVSSKSSSPSPASTPSIIERSIQLVGDSPNSNAKTKSEEEELRLHVPEDYEHFQLSITPAHLLLS
ncbi:mental retardation GTPase activating protein [Senna tora]|uniref:Mental retardation GTPase activating protein n=1 Tax=Senna tora TaxID=362788 RepID=A0A834SVY4_9FABA|nr:mental retardation GTPase activating protein [Senna tora]